jgi:alpha-2-macroglobulin
MKTARRIAFLLIALFLASHATGLAAWARDSRSFSLSTQRTFAPGESIKVQLFAHNVQALEFRVYKVRDTEKFFAGLKDLHSFGDQSWSPEEQIDKRTFLEWLHDFKADLWWRVRRFFRGQFTDDARDAMLEKQASLGKRSRVVGAAEFAQVPLLNQSQLVARWKLVTPPSLVSETQVLPVENPGAGVYLIEATDGTYKAYTIAIVTSMALVERSLNGKAEVFVADRKSGAPIADADVLFWANGHQQSTAKTGADGLASLTLTATTGAEPGNPEPANTEPEKLWVMARRGIEAAVVTPWGYGLNGNSGNGARVFVYTDRPVYRPGHDVHIKAVIRLQKDDALRLPADKTVQLTVQDADDKTVLKKELPISAHGTVSADFTLAADASLGFYSIQIRGERAGGDADANENVGEYLIQGGGSFYVEEYKKPEYQVTVKPAAQRILQGNTLQAVIEARYFFGEPVAGAKVKYVVHTSTHWWWDESDEDSGDEAGEAEGGDNSDDSDDAWGADERQEHEGVLDANGRLSVVIPVGIDAKHYDEDFRVEARVTDEANREVSGHATVLATYGSFRVGVEPTSYLISPGQTPRVKVTAADYDGKPVQTAIHLESHQTHWDSITHTASETVVDKREAATGADGTALVDLPITGSGSFTIVASAVTPEKRTVETRTWLWINNGYGASYNANVQAQLVPDKKSYKVGETAHILLATGLDAKPNSNQAQEFWAVVTAEGNSIQMRQLLHAAGTTVSFDVPITQKAQPNLYVMAMLVHGDQLITAQKSLSVPLDERRLTITATPDKDKYLPGEKGVFDVFAKDAAGKPVETDLSFGAVDEALYAVRPDTTGDILASFYPKRYVYLQPETSFEYYFHGEAGTKSPLLARMNSDGLFHPRMAQVKPGSDLVVPKVRKAFPDTAYWNPTVRTGADGHARVEFTFPDALTTWRETIRGTTDDGKAGGVVTRVLVRKNLIVRLAAPRFLRQGDEATLKVIAHNYLDSAKDVTFALDVAGLDVLSGQATKINVPAKGESVVEWRVRARASGSATLTAKALTNEESDALEIPLPVLPYGVKQRSAGAGVVFSGSGQAQWGFSFPASSDAGTRGLTVTVAPSVAAEVFDSLDYLTGYPWGCAEQTMSSFLPDLIVAQTVDRLHIKSPIDRVTLNKMVNAGLERLYGFEHDDGGWGWWPDDPSRVFMTAYVVSGLGQARSAGYKIDENRLNKGRAWLLSTLAAHPDMIGELRAYVVYALATTGGVPKPQLDALWSDRSQLSNEGLALAGLAFDAAGDSRAKEAAQMLEAKATTTNTDAYWQSNYDGLLAYADDDSAEATAFALKLLVRQDRTSGLMPKAAVWLGKKRYGGYWESTKQTAMVIAGLTDYLSLSGELANSSDVEVLVNGASVGRHHFGPDDVFAAPWKLAVPAQQLGGGGQVTVRKSGNGITYWSAESRWYNADRRLYPSGNLALNATRDYYLLRKKQDKPDDPITYDLVPLNGPVHVGDIVAVRSAVSGTDWQYMLSEDPIPAGTEFLEHSDLYKLNNKPDWWADWFTRREFHDDRAAFFNTEFDRRSEYVYLLKVVTPGRFVISPAQTGPMYQPEVTATTDPATLEVQP